jgi:hypothetical protein
MLQKEQWLEVGAMQLDLDDDVKSIQISVLDVDQLLTEARERIKEKAWLDEKYRELCKQVLTRAFQYRTNCYAGKLGFMYPTDYDS